MVGGTTAPAGAVAAGAGAGAEAGAAFSAAAAAAAAALSGRGGMTTPALEGTAAKALEMPMPALEGTWPTAAAAAAAGWTGTPAFDMAAAALITLRRIVAWSPPALANADMKSTGGPPLAGGPVGAPEAAMDFDCAGSMRWALEVALFATMDGGADFESPPSLH